MEPDIPQRLVITAATPPRPPGTMRVSAPLLPLLQQRFGFDAFRPH